MGVDVEIDTNTSTDIHISPTPVSIHKVYTSVYIRRVQKTSVHVYAYIYMNIYTVVICVYISLYTHNIYVLVC